MKDPSIHCMFYMRRFFFGLVYVRLTRIRRTILELQHTTFKGKPKIDKEGGQTVNKQIRLDMSRELSVRRFT